MVVQSHNCGYMQSSNHVSLLSVGCLKICAALHRCLFLRRPTQHTKYMAKHTRDEPEKKGREQE